jgi:WhiB family redox-sensing transcriptional regulator
MRIAKEQVPVKIDVTMDKDPIRGLLLVGAAQVPRPEWTPGRWRDVGNCRHSDPNLFYPLGRGVAAFEQAEDAKAICRTCPSQEPCLAFALATSQDLGVWGGMSADERRRLLRSRRASVAS